jgi:hypothetical protein
MCPDPVSAVDESVPVNKSPSSDDTAHIMLREAQIPTHPEPSASKSNMTTIALLGVLSACGIAGVVELGTLIGIAQNSAAPASPTIIVNGGAAPDTTSAVQIEGGNPLVPEQVDAPPTGENVCAGTNPNFPNKDCVFNAMVNVGPQAGANVTKGFKGGLDMGELSPITEPYWKKGLCPVNVHWHLGAEHYSAGEYDENGKGSREIDWTTDGGQAPDALGSFQCHHYDPEDNKFTRKYDWKHCIGMEVGQTYEVHWPHSAAGACGTPNQYQTPFYDGVFCNLDVPTFNTLTPQQIALNVGVQGQVFTVVNDESYFRPNLMRGMIVDGEMGTDLAIYTGSSTGSARSHSVCSPYSPITWQVDRKCHMISASSFDLMCAEMKMQRDDMTYDLVAHGARPLVDSSLVADNQQNRKVKETGAGDKPAVSYKTVEAAGQKAGNLRA